MKWVKKRECINRYGNNFSASTDVEREWGEWEERKRERRGVVGPARKQCSQSHRRKEQPSKKSRTGTTKSRSE